MSTNNDSAATAGRVIRWVGGLMLLGVVAFVGIYGCAATGQETNKIEQWWNGQTPVSRAAFCGSLERDPSFDGGAIGIAAAIDDPSISQYDVKSFLFDECFPD